MIALPVEQMKELIALGIDVSKASCCRCKVATPNKIGYEWIILPENLNKCDEEHVPAFILQDMLDMLPRAWEIGAYNANRNTITVFLDDETGHCHQEVSDSLLEAAFNMLKWCKQNNKI